jgi:hypothetical protein
MRSLVHEPIGKHCKHLMVLSTDHMSNKRQRVELSLKIKHTEIYCCVPVLFRIDCHWLTKLRILYTHKALVAAFHCLVWVPNDTIFPIR